ncbi:MAG: acyltransferase [Actinomycetota bacterium]|nr:acyltransferase [Actinomycetota bacterium]
MPAPWRSVGTGRFEPEELGALGARVVFEEGVLVFNPACVHLGDDVYVGHRTMLSGDTRNPLVVGDGSWIGPDCYLHSGGGIRVGENVGLAPRVMVLTSKHELTPRGTPLIFGALEFGPVEIGDGCDVGLGAILLPGARLGANVLVGAGAVVSGAFGDEVVIAGVPARVMRER